MEIRFCISGSIVFTTQSNIVPPVGSEITIRTQSYKKGMPPGTLLNFRVSDVYPPHFYYTDDTVYIDVNDWTVFEPHDSTEN